MSKRTGAGTAEQTSASRAPPARDTRGSVILIAEDHPDNRDALAMLLLSCGYRVFTASNGREAVKAARAHLPDLVLMDVMMPEVDGLEATRELRRDPRFVHTPIIAVTAMEGARPLALQAGADECLRKPISAQRLLTLLRERLEEHSAD